MQVPEVLVDNVIISVENTPAAFKTVEVPPLGAESTSQGVGLRAQEIGVREEKYISLTPAYGYFNTLVV